MGVPLIDANLDTRADDVSSWSPVIPARRVLRTALTWESIPHVNLANEMLYSTDNTQRLNATAKHGVCRSGSG